MSDTKTPFVNSEASNAKIDVAGLFFTVDPERDTPPKVKKYILGITIHFDFLSFIHFLKHTIATEFSPKLMGFTGSKEQVEKVCKTFRVYHSEGPRDQFSDYIVHITLPTVTHIVCLMNSSESG